MGASMILRGPTQKPVLDAHHPKRSIAARRQFRPPTSMWPSSTAHCVQCRRQGPRPRYPRRTPQQIASTSTLAAIPGCGRTAAPLLCLVLRFLSFLLSLQVRKRNKIAPVTAHGRRWSNTAWSHATAHTTHNANTYVDKSNTKTSQNTYTNADPNAKPHTDTYTRHLHQALHPDLHSQNSRHIKPTPTATPTPARHQHTISHPNPTHTTTSHCPAINDTEPPAAGRISPISCWLQKWSAPKSICHDGAIRGRWEMSAGGHLFVK